MVFTCQGEEDNMIIFSTEPHKKQHIIKTQRVINKQIIE